MEGAVRNLACSFASKKLSKRVHCFIFFLASCKVYMTKTKERKLAPLFLLFSTADTVRELGKDEITAAETTRKNIHEARRGGTSSCNLLHCLFHLKEILLGGGFPSRKKKEEWDDRKFS